MINFNITAEIFFLIADIMEEIGKLSEFSKGLDNFPKLKKEMLIKSVCATLCFDDIVGSAVTLRTDAQEEEDEPKVKPEPSADVKESGAKRPTFTLSDLKF